MPVTWTRKDAVETAKTTGKDGKESEGEYPEIFVWVPCIRYSIIFQKKSMPTLALFNSGSEINTTYPTLAQELGLSLRPTDVGDQKIDGYHAGHFWNSSYCLFSSRQGKLSKIL